MALLDGQCRLARSFLEALDVASEGSVADARMSLGRRVGVLGEVPRDCVLVAILDGC